jgi:hypothetical protein
MDEINDRRVFGQKNKSHGDRSVSMQLMEHEPAQAWQPRAGQGT